VWTIDHFTTRPRSPSRRAGQDAATARDLIEGISHAAAPFVPRTSVPHARQSHSFLDDRVAPDEPGSNPPAWRSSPSRSFHGPVERPVGPKRRDGRRGRRGRECIAPTVERRRKDARAITPQPLKRQAAGQETARPRPFPGSVRLAPPPRTRGRTSPRGDPPIASGRSPPPCPLRQHLKVDRGSMFASKFGSVHHCFHHDLLRRCGLVACLLFFLILNSFFSIGISTGILP